MKKRIGVFGAGAWGTSLALHAARLHHQVTLCGRPSPTFEKTCEHLENKVYLPGFKFPNNLKLSHCPEELIKNVDLALVVVPCQHMRDYLKKLESVWPMNVPIILCSKGIECETGSLMVDVAKACLPRRDLVVLSGPTFALELAKGLPCALTLASKNASISGDVAKCLQSFYFRPYFSRDVMGVSVAGALKNVLALASGVADGAEMGCNAQAALLTRGMAEIGRFADIYGGEKETLLGLSGMGDMILTCMNNLSRNFSFGQRLGRGESIEHIFKTSHHVVEGVHTANAVVKVLPFYDIEMPICQSIYAMIEHQATLDETIEALLSRPLRFE